TQKVVNDLRTLCIKLIQHVFAIPRREMREKTGTGLRLLGLADLFAAEPPTNPHAPKAPHFAPRAKRIVHIYLNGGPSHIDTFDPKPALQKYESKVIPTGNLTT